MISDKIDDGFSEEEAVASLDDVSEIANELLAELPLATLIQSRVKQSHEKSSHKTLWIILAICGFPIWLPLMLSIVAVIFSIFVCIWAVVTSFISVEIVLAISGVMSIVAGATMAFGQNLTGFVLISMGLIAIGLFILLILPLVWLAKKTLSLTLMLFKKIKRLFISKKGV